MASSGLVNDRFDLRGLLGQGSFGIVYNAVDTKQDIAVAVKVEEKRQHPQLSSEAHILNATRKDKGFPKLYWYG